MLLIEYPKCSTCQKAKNYLVSKKIAFETRNIVEEKLQILSTDGMLVKRPLLELDDIVLIGFKEIEWNTIKECN